MIRLTIIGEPASKANSRKVATVGPKDNRRTLFIKSQKARHYERDALMQIPMSAKQMLAGRIRMTLRIYYASERPDLDESIVLDVLQAKFQKNKATGARELVRKGVYLNDRQVRERHVYHCIDRLNPRAEIEIEIEEVEPMLLEAKAGDVHEGFVGLTKYVQDHNEAKPF